MGVDEEVNIAHAVAQFRIRKGVVDVAILIGLDRGKRTNGLAQYGQLLDQNAGLPCLGGEGGAFDSHHVAAVEQLLEDGVVEGFVLAWTQLIPVQVNLHAPAGILKLGKRGFSHDAAGENAACKADFAVIGKVRSQCCSMGVHGVCRGRVWVNSQLTELLEALQSDAFLFRSDHVGLIHSEIRLSRDVIPEVN